jgi:hypothetical protein
VAFAMLNKEVAELRASLAALRGGAAREAM